MRFSIVIALAAAVACAPFAQADEVITADGSRIVGTVTSVEDGKVKVKTAFAGDLTIDQAKVQQITTDEVLNVRLASGNTLVGTVTRQGASTIVNTTNGPMDITSDSITAVWPKDGKSPEVRKAEAETAAAKKAAGHWIVEAGLDIAGTSGNKDSFGYGGSVRAELKRSDDRLLMYADGKRTEVEGDTTAERLRGGIEYEHNISEKSTWYVRTELTYDEIKDLNLRTDVAGGYGYYFLRDDETPHTLLGRAGVLFRHEDYDTGTDQQSVGLDLSLTHDWKFKPWGRVRNHLAYTPSFEDTNDYQLNHETSVDILLANSKSWTLRLGVANEYVSMPAPGKEELDTAYFLRLVYKWEQKH